MARKSYSDEFRRQAVDLYESTPGATFKGIAADLGITRGALAEWVRALGTGTTTTTAGMTAAGSPGPAFKASRHVPAARSAPGSGKGESAAARIARLEARVAELEAETTKLSTEREILSPGGEVFRGRDELVSRFQFVADHRNAYGVKRLCQVLQVNRSSFYAWLAAAPGTRRAGGRRPGTDRTDPRGPRGRPGLRRTADHRRTQRRRPARPAGQPQAGRPGDARGRGRRDPAASPGPHHNPRASRPEGP